jgi:hypothetical protein
MTTSDPMPPDPHAWVLREGVVRRAQGELGVREATGRNDGVPAERYHYGRCEPWCGAFVRYLFEQCGQPVHGSHSVKTRGLLSWVQYLEDTFKRHHHWRAVTSDYEPRKGDVAFWTGRDQSDPGKGRHCSIVESVDFEDRRLTVISGNWRDAVARHVVDWSPKHLTGFGWVL